MLKKVSQDGFALAETLVALLLLTIGAHFLIPVITTSQREIEYLGQEKEALTLVHSILLEWSLNGQPPPSSILQDHVTYTIQFSQDGTKGQVCVNWVLTKKRTMTECGEMKR